MADNELSVTDICHSTHLDTGTRTPLLKRLEVRARSEVDERKRVISLTRKGAMLQKAADSACTAMACLDVLTPHHAQQWKEMVDLLYRNLSTRAQTPAA